MSETAKTSGARGLVPRLRFPEFRATPSWHADTLANLCGRITNGSANAQDHEEGGLYPLFDRSEVVKRSNSFIFDAEAVILPGEGMRLVPRYFHGKFNLHQRAYALMEHRGNARFIYYALDHYNARLLRNAVKSTVPSLRLPIIQRFAVPVPSTSEQQKIADCLSSLDDLITAHADKLAALKRHKQGLLERLFPREGETVPRLRFPEFDGQNAWRATTLGEICDPHQWPTISSADLTPSGYPVYGANGLIGYYSEFNHAAETVAVTCRGSTCGEVTLVPAKSYITGNSMCLDKIDNCQASDRFIFQCLKRRGLDDVISGSAQPQIVGNVLKRLALVLPSTAEQAAITGVLSTLDTLITAQSDRLTALKQHKQGLLQQLFPVMDEAAV